MYDIKSTWLLFFKIIKISKMCFCFKKKGNKAANHEADGARVSCSKHNRRSYKRTVPYKDIKQSFLLKDRFICLFCGGSRCKNEDWTCHSSSPIKGLNCDLIDDIIFASQRPSTVLLSQYKLLDQFKQKKIGLIVNLQREGEHPYCGPNLKLENSGFTYNPQTFINNGIDVLHMGWKDMSVPDSVGFILKIVKEMHNMIHCLRNRVLVHCHAGYGRTGVVIACYLIYSRNMKAQDAILFLRSYRKNCVQKKKQVEFCELFERHIKSCKQIFTPSKEDINLFIRNQKDILSDSVQPLLEHQIPRIITEITGLIAAKLPSIFNFSNLIINEVSKHKEDLLFQLKGKINCGCWSSLENSAESDISLLNLLLLDWLQDCVSFSLSHSHLQSIFERTKYFVKESIHKKEITFNFRLVIIESLNFFNSVEAEILLEICYLLTILKIRSFQNHTKFMKELIRTEGQAENLEDFPQNIIQQIEDMNSYITEFIIGFLGQIESDLSSYKLFLSKLPLLIFLSNESIQPLLVLQSLNLIQATDIASTLHLLILIISNDMTLCVSDLNLIKKSKIGLSTIYSWKGAAYHNDSQTCFKLNNDLFKSMCNDLNKIVEKNDTELYCFFVRRYKDVFAKNTIVSYRNSKNASLHNSRNASCNITPLVSLKKRNIKEISFESSKESIVKRASSLVMINDLLNETKYKTPEKIELTTNTLQFFRKENTEK